MKFSISELVAKITGLQERADIAFKQELNDLKAAVNDQMTQLAADLKTAQASITSLGAEKEKLTTDLSAANGQLTDANTSLTAAATALRSHLATIPGHEDYKDGGAKATATLAELITAETNATNTAMKAAGLKATTLPEAAKTATATGNPQDPKPELKGRARMIAAMKIEGVTQN